MNKIIRREKENEITAAKIFHNEGTYDFDNMGTGADGRIYQGGFDAESPRQPVNEPTAAGANLSSSDIQNHFQHTENLPDTDHYSQLTEPSYEYGSYLAPANQSYLHIVNNAK